MLGNVKSQWLEKKRGERRKTGIKRFWKVKKIEKFNNQDNILTINSKITKYLKNVIAEA